MTDRQRRFIEEYCIDFNGTRAALKAGYSEKTARSLACQLLTNVNIKGAINTRLDEMSMTAEEATKRLTDWGRGTPKPFLYDLGDGEFSIDLATNEAQKNLHLIKKLKQTRRRWEENDEPIEEIRTEIELHDAKDAVIQIARIRGKLGGNLNVNINGLSDWLAQGFEKGSES